MIKEGFQLVEPCNFSMLEWGLGSNLLRKTPVVIKIQFAKERRIFYVRKINLKI